MAGVCSRFVIATVTTIEELKNCSKNENTAKSTYELNTLLEHSYAEVKNKQGEDYEPESINVMMEQRLHPVHCT